MSHLNQQNWQRQRVWCHTCLVFGATRAGRPVIACALTDVLSFCLRYQPRVFFRISFPSTYIYIYTHTKPIIYRQDESSEIALFRLTLGRYCRTLTCCMNLNDLIGHERASSILCLGIMAVLWLLITFWCKHMKCIILHEGERLRLAVCGCYSWQIVLSTTKKLERMQGKL